MVELYHGVDHTVGRLNYENEVSVLLDVFKEIAREQGWDPGDQLEKYLDNAVHWVLLKKDTTEIMGGLQLVMGNRDGLPVASVWPELGLLGRTDLADVALLAMKEQYRSVSRQLFWPLCVEMWRYCRRLGVVNLWCEVTSRKLRGYRLIGLPFEEAGSEKVHWGEPCVPCLTTISMLEKSIVELAEASSRYKGITSQAFRQDGDCEQ